MEIMSGENMTIIILVASISLPLVSASTGTLPPRSVNVALETSFLFEPKDLNDNVAFIKNIKGFLDKLYNILSPQVRETQKFRSQPQEKPRRFSFVDFIKNIGETFNNLTDGNIHKAIKSLEYHVTAFANKSRAAVKEIFPTDKVKNIVHSSLRKWAMTDTELMRNYMKKLTNDKNPLIQNIGRRMNDYYNDEDLRKLNNILKKIGGTDTNTDISKLLKEGLQFGIVDKYKNLNSTSRMNLVNDLKLIADFVKEKNILDVEEGNKIQARKHTADTDIDLSSDKDIHDSIEKYEMYNELKETIDNKLKLASKHLDGDKKGVSTNQIIVDNVELFLQNPNYR